jgi:hypothetical protein
MTCREDLIKYRRERNAETLEDARMMFGDFCSIFGIQSKPGD